MRPERLHPDGPHPPDRGPKADRRLDGRRSRFEAERHVARHEVAGCVADDVLVERHHSATHLIERKGAEVFALPVEDAHAARAERLVRARREEVDVERTDVDRQMGE